MKTTEVIFILDRSGSMSGLETDTIGGYNSILKQQREAEGDVNITTVLFDDRYELLHNRESIRNVSDLTAKEYYVRGCTALVDAMGITISRFIAAAIHNLVCSAIRRSDLTEIEFCTIFLLNYTSVCGNVQGFLLGCRQENEKGSFEHDVSGACPKPLLRALL
ncbi:MAG: hypothetical protein IKE12_05610 [Erysipelotrichaceae bacterium]|nr:hypothetical protein [Erysipelotrichaceae bacterium]